MSLAEYEHLAPAGEAVSVAVNRLFAAARVQDYYERRDNPRTPFFQPVTVRWEADAAPAFSAFCRDLSEEGIGLLHLQAVECGPAIVRMADHHGGYLDFRVLIQWNTDCGDGWHMSGGALLEMV